MGLVGIDLELPTIQSQKNVSSKKGYPFVSIDEGMIHYERFEKGRCHLSDIFVVATTRSKQGALQQSHIADSGRSTKSLDEPFLNGEDFVDGEKEN